MEGKLDDISDLTDLSTLKNEVVYSWIDPDTGLTFIFAVGRMVEACKRLNAPVTEGVITKEHRDFVFANRGIEQHRLDRLKNAGEFEPILMAEWPDGTHLTLDGNHRTVAAYDRGDKTIKAWITKPEFWRQFIISISNLGQLPEKSGIA